MTKVGRWYAPVSCTVLAGSLLFGTAAAAQEIDYSKAERFLNWNTSRMVSGDEVNAHWYENGDTDRFWYRNKTGSGYEFMFVDPVRGVRRPLFDHFRKQSVCAAMQPIGQI